MRRIHRLLEWLLPHGVGPAALADLDRERAERPPGSAGRLWYLWEGLKLVLHLRLGRAADALRPPRTIDLVPAMDGLSRNFRFALRRLRRNLGFALTAVLTLALGVGANVAVFSVVNAVLLRPLPYRAPGELVVLAESPLTSPRVNVANPGNVRAWRERSNSLAAVAHVVFSEQAALVERDGRTQEIAGMAASPNYFDVLGVEAEVGRTFVADAGDGDAVEVVLSHRFWTTWYGADPSVVGQTIELSGRTTAEIVGVLPEAFILWGEGADLWMPFTAEEYDQTNSGRFLNVVGRLTPGATLEQANAELQAVAAGLREEHPEPNAGWTAMAVPLQEHVVGPVNRILWVLLGSVTLLLLIACANVSNLFLARATGRRKEMAVRTSLGASRGTLAGQLLVESAVLSGIAGAVGVVVAHVATRTAATRLPEAFALPRVEGVGVDGRTLLFALGVTVVTALLFGILPALQASAADPGEALSAESRSSSRAAGRTRGALVIAEVAVSVLLLVGAGLVVRSLDALLSEDIGIEPAGVLTAHVSLVTESYREPEARVAFAEDFVARVQTIPGVEAAGLVPFLPLDGLGSRTGYWAGDRPRPELGEEPGADVRMLAGDYFGAMGIRLLRGRTFDSRDRADGPRVVIIDHALADEAWPGEDPLGKPLVLSWDGDEVAEVVGVVENVRQGEVETAPYPTVYYPYAQFADFSRLALAVRSSGPPSRLLPAIEEQLHAVDPPLALADVREMDDVVSRAVARPRMTAVLMGFFAVIAAALAGVGLYGVLSYAVSQRVREIGVRMALGAAPREVLGRVVGEGMALVFAGLVLGVGAALLASRFLAALLYGVEPTDALAMLGACGFLALVALAACALPAWRATRVDPAVALRTD